MRDIKFRAWCPDLLEMFEQDSDSAFVFHNKGLILKTLDQIFETGSGVAVENWEYIERPKAIFMQFTGLQDKNGVDIYEGDILTGGVSFIGCKPIYQVVEWSHKSNWSGMADGYTKNNIGFNIDEYYIKLKSCEVIGNIHSNPELLEQSL